jgi:ParB-like nuclease domain
LPKEPNWKLESLAVGDVREHPSFQNREQGTSRNHIEKLRKQLQSGAALPPIKVAKIGKALYVVSGFHRLSAYRLEGYREIEAETARMSKPEAEEYALLENTDHGKPLTHKDKEGILRRFVEQGRHLWKEGEGNYTNYAGTNKNPRQIAKELKHAIAHTTVINKFIKWGIDMPEDVAYPNGYKPQHNYGLLEEEALEEATENLWAFESLYHDLEDGNQESLLRTAREIIEALENGERPVRPVAAVEGEVVLDI